MSTTTDPAEDLQRRWRPSATAVAAAMAALEATAEADVAVIPMYQPGKVYDIWEIGQRVETVELEQPDVLLAVNSHNPEGTVPGVSAMKDRAFELAKQALAAEGGGTTAYAVLRRNGRCSVFEEILSA